MTRLTLVIPVFAFFLSSNIEGAVVYTYNDTSGYAASDILTSPVASATQNYFLRNNATDGTPTTNRSGLQTISVGVAFELGAINLLVNRVANGSVTEFKLLDFGTADPNGSSITTANVNAAAVLKSYTHTQATAFGADALTTLTWTLDNSVILSATNYYGLLVIGKDANNNALVWQRANTNPYANGQAYLNPTATTSYTTAEFGSGGAGATGNDWALGLVAIPEPASLALFGLGGLVGLGRGRRV